MAKRPGQVNLNPTTPPKLADRSNAGYGEHGVDLNAAASKPKRRSRKKK
jgi:hypothetical protein